MQTLQQAIKNYNGGTALSEIKVYEVGGLQIFIVFDVERDPILIKCPHNHGWVETSIGFREPENSTISYPVTEAGMDTCAMVYPEAKIQ
ncbi:hypothetical protein [Erwinia phyllosphaerae]|uniref:hypothetical protein n=1 Tax=Erwinia phyllosphaerae TaxID=2853256 RepID=UPI001FEE0CE3|nr:hypothetical protein [Erwinia phyllosphaerae]MBV4366270.1 hypothetical protein [Erwinia phyllosphaerae]